MSLGVEAGGPPTGRERSLAVVIAGFAYPGKGGFHHLSGREQEACLLAAREALAIAARP